MRNGQKPETGGFYRHFKGGLYQVRCTATHSESGEEMVVYQAMYPPYQTWVRPLDLFMGPVDPDKYPGVQQEWRFVRVDPEQMMPVDTERANAVMPGAGAVTASHDAAGKSAEKTEDQKRQEPAIKTPRISAEHAKGTGMPVEAENSDITDEELKQAILSGKAQEILAGRVSDEELGKRGFMMILDAGTSREKRALVIGLQKVLTPLQMSNLAVALDIVLPDGTRQEKLDSLIHCLGTLEKYECQRLR